jgi:hypothetical protein
MEVKLGNFGETKYTYFWLHLGITIIHPQPSVMPFTHLWLLAILKDPKPKSKEEKG